MPQSSALRLSDLRAIHQLVGECRELGDDPQQWREHLLGWAIRVGGAVVANEYEVEFGPKTVFGGIVGRGWANSGLEEPYFVAVNAEFERRGVTYCPMITPYLAAADRGEGPCLSRLDLVADPDWYGSEYFQLYHGPSRADTMLYCFLPQTNGRISAVALVRATKEPDFTRRAKSVLAAAHTLVAPLIGGRLAGYADPSPAVLPPRVRQVLRCLLEGDADKQVALRLGLTRHTVNQYAKMIFRHFGVRSRAELLARWVRRGWGSRFAWSDDDTKGRPKNDEAPG